MDSDFASKLQSVLSNPEAMAKITSIASSLGADTQSQNQPQSQPQDIATTDPTPQFPNPLGNLSVQTDPRLALLASVKPLLREDKRNRIDSLLTALTMANVFKSFKK